jgi:hypothetical protein
MTGLPGYDDWLDNYGNPGMEREDGMTENNPRWPITEEIDVTQRAPDIYDISRVNGANCFELSVSDGPNGRQLFIDGSYQDLGDDFIAYISIIDDYHEQNGGEMGQTIRMNPWEVQEELPEDRIES